jgi:hypothetical protein
VVQLFTNKKAAQTGSLFMRLVNIRPARSF